MRYWHASFARFGLTYQQIEADGFTIDYKVETLLSSDTGTAIAKSIGLGTIGFADAFEQLQPTYLVVGDRYEILAAVTAALAAEFLWPLPRGSLPWEQ